MAEKEYNGIMVFLEHRKNMLRNASIQLVGEGRRLADLLNIELSGALLGKGLVALAQEAIQYGLDKVHLVEHELLRDYAPRPYATALAELVDRRKPEALLFGATMNGREVAGRLHAYIHTGLAADCTAFDVTEDGYIEMIRPAFGGKSLAHILCKKTKPQMASARPNVFPAPEKDVNRKGEIVREMVQLTEKDVDTKCLSVVEYESEAEILSRAEIILSGGYGLKKKENFALLEELAELLHGVVGASRKVVDIGWFPRERQIGQTGKTVRPRLYFAIGISGAVQHLAGMERSEKIVAINSDPSSSIFEIADYGIVGNMLEVLPEMIRQLKEMQQEAGQSSS
ncbi:MAG: electron transfer flavoprotein subunit alpha/FixB family protein [Methanomassiliicoccales archaeon]|nr:MAG: electron transfer flavoprotein subunit alpha/FixB family protein [Methanomassiliicoccales archaeon]